MKNKKLLDKIIQEEIGYPSTSDPIDEVLDFMNSNKQKIKKMYNERISMGKEADIFKIMSFLYFQANHLRTNDK